MYELSSRLHPIRTSTILLYCLRPILHHLLWHLGCRLHLMSCKHLPRSDAYWKLLILFSWHLPQRLHLRLLRPVLSDLSGLDSIQLHVLSERNSSQQFGSEYLCCSCNTMRYQLCHLLHRRRSFSLPNLQLGRCTGRSSSKLLSDSSLASFRHHCNNMRLFMPDLLCNARPTKLPHLRLQERARNFARTIILRGMLP